MSSKPEIVRIAAAADARSPLRGGVLELQGRDAGVFAQAQLMNDVRALADGHWQWTGWLSPKGRVIVLGALLRLTEERYWLLLPDFPAVRLAQELSRFVFRAKLTLRARDELTSRGVWCAPQALDSPARHNRFDMRDSIARLDWSGERPRTLLVGLEPDLERAVEHVRADVATTIAWAAEDLAHGFPRLGADAGASHTPQMLGLTRLDAYSVKKGCYPGQEIVARTHFLGQAKRVLQRLKSSSPLGVGETLLVDGVAVGDVLCAESEGNRHEALAVLPLGQGQLMMSGENSAAAVTVVDFKLGLAR